ncbi:MAG: type II secretion system protein GspN [Pseudomonadota bacterium]
MGKVNHKILYAVYSICVTLFFLYYLFPSKAIKEFLLSKIGQMAPGLSVSIEDVRPAFPIGLKFVNVSIQNSGKPIMDANRLSITPGLLSLLAGKIAIDIDCEVYEGKIEATIGLSGKDFLVNTADVELNHIQIGDILFLKDHFPHDASGSLDGRVNYKKGEDNRNTFIGDLVLSELIIDFSSSLHGLDKLNLQKIEVTFESNRSEVKLNRFVNMGGDVDGSLSGTILINRRIEKSVLNLSGTVNPNPVFADKLGKLGPIVKRLLKKSSGEGFPVKLQGTFEKPRFF